MSLSINDITRIIRASRETIKQNRERAERKDVPMESNQCWLCEDYDTICQVVCYLPSDNGGATDIPINHCPVCGKPLKEV